MERSILFGYYFVQCFNRWRLIVHGWHARSEHVEPKSTKVTAAELAAVAGSGDRIENGTNDGAAALDLVIDWSQIEDTNEAMHQLLPTLIQWKGQPGKRIFHTAKSRVPQETVRILEMGGCWQSEI